MKLSDVPWWAWAGGVGLVALLIAERDEVGDVVNEAVDEVEAVVQTGVAMGGALGQALQYAGFFQASAAKYGLRASVLASVCWRESAFGLTLSPPGPAGVGDAGHGRGLMQIDDRSHAVWLAVNNWRDPATNIDGGAEILAQAYAYFRMPGASANDPRPLSGAALDKAALAAYNAGAGAVLRAIIAGQDPDSVTTGHDYGSWILGRVDSVASQVGLV